MHIVQFASPVPGRLQLGSLLLFGTFLDASCPLAEVETNLFIGSFIYLTDIYEAHTMGIQPLSSRSLYLTGTVEKKALTTK